MAQPATNGGKTAGAGTAAKAAPDTEDLSAQLTTLRQDVETLNEMVRDLVSHKFTSVRAQAQEAAEEARSAAKRQARNAADTAQYYQQEAEAAVRNNPSAALGIATGIGFLAGLLLSRR
jgi:ElaB/YqjD/DUF883 family membrane-anchored ribosome-binding protein